MNHLSELLSRKVAEPAARQAQQAVEVLSLRQVAAARALRMNDAMARFCALLADDVNVRDGVILVPVPWGSGLRWGLSRNERDAMRRWVVARRVSRRSGRSLPAAFVYDEGGRRWTLGMMGEDLAQWVAGHPITAEDVLRFWCADR
jgi:hypothetical protein